MANDAQSLLDLAARHQSAGQWPQAIAAYQRLLQIRPDLPNSWYNLGRLQRRNGQPEAALASYAQALRHGVSQPEEVHLNRGVIFAEDLHQSAAAEQALRLALQLNPAYIPAWLNLANLHEDRGQRAQALAAYEQLLAIDPHCHEGLARYASLRGANRGDDTIIQLLRQAVLNAATPMADKASLGFALGKLLDGAGEYDAAFCAYQTANQHSRASAPGSVARYDRQAHTRFIDELIAAFPGHGRTASQQAMPAGSPRPIFICGMFRSGSTLTEQVLAAHSEVRAGGELVYLPELVRGPLAPYPARLASLSAADLSALAAAYLGKLQRLASGAGHVTDKRPDNYLHIGLIKTLFPSARIIHTTRNPLDNGLSIYFLHLSLEMAYALDLGDIGYHYSEYRRLMAHWKALYGDDILDFDYDQFVVEPQPQTERLLRWCGLGWEDACLAFDRVENSVRTASVWQVRQALYRHSSGRWRHYAAHLAPLREALGLRAPSN
jgi:tetratricopeptide (TPR) repeat protein